MADGNDFAELLWENGQAVVHGRRKPPPPASTFPPPLAASSSRAHESHKHAAGGDPVALFKTGVDLFGLDAAPRDTGNLDDTVPWIHCPIIDDDSAAATPALAESYSPDFFADLQAAAASLNSLLPPPATSTHHAAGGNRSNVPGATSSRPEPAEAAKVDHRASAAPAAGRPDPQAELAATKQQQQPRPRGGGEGVMNFSLFSRPAAMALLSRPVAQVGTTDKASNATTSTRVESTVVQGATNVPPRPAAAVFADQRPAAWPPQPKEVRFACEPAAPPASAARNMQPEMPPSSSSMPAQKKAEAARKATEAAVAASSVRSGIGGAGAGHDESWRHQQQKRKSQAECSASPDDDLDDESGGPRRSGSRGTKRSRTAEVHNLSERRRRDRINEKMRALQELIPNCNKIDKASMLDEAIEYLKTLQLQVQIMSMGGGLCIPPMLLPPAMQHLQISAIAHFPHLGMGFGYGMGVFDMNSTAAAATAAAAQLAPMSGAQFPCPMIPAAGAPQGLGMPGRNAAVPMFGVPGQHAIHPMASAGLQQFPSLAAGLPVRPNLAPKVPVNGMVQEQQQQGVASHQQHDLSNAAAGQGADTGDPQLQAPVQQVDNQHFRMPASAVQTECVRFLDGGNVDRTDATERNGSAGT